MNLFTVPFPPPEKPSFTFIDLFAGIGGFRLALQELGGQCVFSSEINEPAKKTYEANFGEYPYGDIREFTKSEISDYELDKLIPDHDLLTAGFPCQPFSRAGVSARNYLGQDHGFQDENQGNLFFDIVRIALVKKPKVLFLENVKNFRSHDQGKTFETVKTIIEKQLGYYFYSAIINSSSLVPQKRERFYMVCLREKVDFEFPKINGKPLPIKLILEENVSDIFTLSDKLWEGHQKRSQRNKLRGVGFTVKLANLDKPSNTIVARYYKDGKECLIPQEGKNPRMLTPRECARLQGFPEKFILAESRRYAYQQFGNSVAVPVIYTIAEKILLAIQKMNYKAEINEIGLKGIEDLNLWEKCYWYLRILIKRGSASPLGKDTDRLENIYNRLTTYYNWVQSYDNSTEQYHILLATLEQTILENIKDGTKKKERYQETIEELKKYFISPQDFLIFAIVIKEILLPTNEAVSHVPAAKATLNLVKTYAQAVLDTKKEQGLKNLIRDWDEFTMMLSMNKERDLLVNLFRNVRINLRKRLKNFNQRISGEDLDIVLTCICQEYERRTGQTRKQRSGKDLENCTEFIFNYFGIETGGKPKHITAGLEIDNWLKDRNDWYIGISLKRTFRERWKQVYTTEENFYENHKIKNIIWLINYDFDISTSVIKELGSYRGLLFFADDSPMLSSFLENPEISSYVFPMTQLISKVKELIDC